MILDIIFVPLIYIFNFFLSMFPVLEFDISITSGLSSVFANIDYLNRYLPLNETFTCLTIVFVLINASTIIYCGNWLLNKIMQLIPFIG